MNNRATYFYIRVQKPAFRYINQPEIVHRLLEHELEKG